jgi:hypothetical protein
MIIWVPQTLINLNIFFPERSSNVKKGETKKNCQNIRMKSRMFYLRKTFDFRVTNFHATNNVMHERKERNNAKKKK